MVGSEKDGSRSLHTQPKIWSSSFCYEPEVQKAPIYLSPSSLIDGLQCVKKPSMIELWTNRLKIFYSSGWFKKTRPLTLDVAKTNLDNKADRDDGGGKEGSSTCGSCRQAEKRRGTSCICCEITCCFGYYFLIGRRKLDDSMDQVVFVDLQKKRNDEDDDDTAPTDHDLSSTGENEEHEVEDLCASPASVPSSENVSVATDAEVCNDDKRYGGGSVYSIGSDLGFQLEIELSKLKQDEMDTDVATDTLYVAGKPIVDPYGEKGVYTGALSNSTGMPNGKGRLEYEEEGGWYEGGWIHGRRTGYGRLKYCDGDLYEGELKNDHLHGHGVMRFADGRVFEGEYICGQRVQGKMKYQDGSVYSGSWVYSMRHGRGKCIFMDGSEYEGEFREGNFHGHGKMTWNDEGWYIGEWCDGKMHGKGKEIRPDGTLRHDGEWSRSLPIRNKTMPMKAKDRSN